MKTLLASLSLAIAAVSLATAPFDAEARRLGGGRPAGMQRQAPPPQKPADAPTQPGNAATQNSTAPTAGAAAPAAAGTAAAAGSRSWMGPIAGLAAGLGIAALMSHLGLGAAFANFLTMLLLALVAFVAIRWLMHRMAGAGARAPGAARLAGAGAPLGSASPLRDAEAPPASSWQPAVPEVVPSRTAPALPPGFDAEGFERVAKMIFIRLQAANDAAQIDDLRKFTTPELFASLRLDLQERGDARQQTDVLQLDAKVLEATQEDGQWIATVRFSGLIREDPQAAAEPFDELWHLVKPVDGSREWAIAGITPVN